MEVKARPAQHRALLRPMIFLGIVLVVALGSWLLAHSQQQTRNGYATKRLQLAGRAFTLLVADTEAKQTKGLGSRDSLPQDQGMLFVYPGQQSRCFWMKDMRFALDIVWLNTQRQVVAVDEHVPADSYPKTYCHTAQYILEFNSGTAAKSGLHNGQTLDF